MSATASSPARPDRKPISAPGAQCPKHLNSRPPRPFPPIDTFP